MRLELLDQAGHQADKQMLVHIVSMLIQLAKACEQEAAPAPFRARAQARYRHGHVHGVEF